MRAGGGVLAGPLHAVHSAGQTQPVPLTAITWPRMRAGGGVLAGPLRPDADHPLHLPLPRPHLCALHQRRAQPVRDGAAALRRPPRPPPRGARCNPPPPSLFPHHSSIFLAIPLLQLFGGHLARHPEARAASPLHRHYFLIIPAFSWPFHSCSSSAATSAATPRQALQSPPPLPFPHHFTILLTSEVDLTQVEVD